MVAPALVKVASPPKVRNGSKAAHGLAHMHRAVLEGVAFAVKRHIDIMQQASGERLERVIASGGGARTKLWMTIKASVYDIPIVVPQEAECGIVGCAAMAATATGQFGSIEAAADRYVCYSDEILPNPAWAEGATSALTLGRRNPVLTWWLPLS